MPEVVGTDRGGGHSSAQRTLQAARTLMEVFLWKLESKNQRLCSRSGSHGVNQVFAVMPPRDVHEKWADYLLFRWVLMSKP